MSKAYGCDDKCQEVHAGEPVQIGHSFALSDDKISLVICVEKVKGDMCPDCFSKRTRELFRCAITNGSFQMVVRKVPVSVGQDSGDGTARKAHKRVKRSKVRKTVESSDKYIDTLEAGKLLGLTRQGIWELAKRKHKLAYKQGNQKTPLMILKSDVMKLKPEYDAKKDRKNKKSR